MSSISQKKKKTALEHIEIEIYMLYFMR